MFGKNGEQSQDLADWLEAHPQREDLYSALRPARGTCLQDRTFLDEIDQLQPSLRTTQLCDLEALNELNATDAGISWFIPSVSHLVSICSLTARMAFLRTVFRLH